MSGHYSPESACDPLFWASLENDAAVDACARLDPQNALQFAALRLSPARLDWCALRAPAHALTFMPSGVSAAAFEELVKIDPHAVVQHAAGRLSLQQAESIAYAHSALGVALSAQLSRNTLLWVAGRRPIDALVSDACCDALGGEVVDALAREVWEKAQTFPGLRAVFHRAPHILKDAEIHRFLAGEGRQAKAIGGPTSRYRAALQPAVIPRLLPEHLAEAAEHLPTLLLWMGIEHLPTAVRERALSLEHPEQRAADGAAIPASRWAQIERLSAELRGALTGEAPVASAPAM